MDQKPFDYDPSLLDDELLLQFINGVISPTPLKDDGDVILPVVPANHAQNTSILISHDNPILARPLEISPLQRGNPEAAPSNKGKGKGKGKGKNNSNATEIERERRHVMSSLYEDLRSLLPANKNGKRRQSISDLLENATNHINNLQVGIKGLNDKKERLRKKRSAPNSNSCSSSMNSNQQKYHVTVKPYIEGIVEVIVGTDANNNNHVDNETSNQNVPLSKVLGLLNEEGLNVINCVTSRADDKFIHTIQAQVDDERTLDLGLLQQTLTNLHYL